MIRQLVSQFLLFIYILSLVVLMELLAIPKSLSLPQPLYTGVASASGCHVTTIGGSTMTATNHDDQVGEICPTMLNELNCTFGVSFSRFHCFGHHGHGLWPSWFVAIMV